MTRLVLLLASLATGCTFGPYVVERTVGGERREGPFVPPYAYEHFVRAELAMATGDFGTAADELALARSGGDDDALLCARHAVALERSGHGPEADRALADGFALDAESEAVHLAASEIAELRGDPAGALEHAVHAVRIAPRSRPAALRLSAVLERGGQPDEAARVLAGLEGAPVELWIEAALRSGDVERAMGLARRATLDRSARVRLAALLSEQPALCHELLAPLASEPPESDAERRLRIDTAVATNERAEAEGLLALPPAGASELADARAWIALGEGARAVELAEAVRAATPSVEADVVLARALLTEGRADEAAALAASVPSASSHAAEARAVLAEALSRAGLPELAAETAAR